MVDWPEALAAGRDNKMVHFSQRQSTRSGLGFFFLDRRALPVSLLLLGVLVCALVLARLPCPLLEPEETRYAEIPRQMLARGNFLTPLWQGQPYYHKPPLLYWLVMASYRLLGSHDWSARLVPCGAALGLWACTCAWAYRRVRPGAALAAGALLGLSGALVYRATMLSMDSLLALWVMLALWTAHEALTGSLFGWKWWLISAAACGLGILTKGPVALVLVVVPVAGFLFWERERPAVPRLGWLAYLVVSLGLAGPWFVFLACREPEAASAFFWLHHVQRYLDPLDHGKPGWYYFPLLMTGLLPGSLLLLPLVIEKFRAKKVEEKDRPVRRFLVLAWAWCLLFFSLSGCKRPGYILPAWPLLALILGTYLAERFPLSRLRVSCGARIALISGMTGLSLFFLAGAYLFLPAYHSRFCLRDLVRAHQGKARTATIRVACYPRLWDSVPFYLDRNDIQVYSSSDRARLLADLQEGKETLLFVKAASLVDLWSLVPAGLEWRAQAPSGKNLAVVLIRPQPASY